MSGPAFNQGFKDNCRRSSEIGRSPENAVQPVMAKAEEKDSSARNERTLIKDDRFSSIQTDPRFKLPNRRATKETLDTRFKLALDEDEDFREKSRTDKYGRRIQKASAKSKLKNIYNMDSVSETGSDDEGGSNEESDSDLESRKPAPEPTLLERMRGDADSDLSSSSEEESSDIEDSASDEGEDEFSASAKLASAKRPEIPQGDETHRFAVVNMDWDNIRSLDLLATFSSFVPAGRRINSVKIFPSDYGKARMQEEELNGPPKDLFVGENEVPVKPFKDADAEDDDDQDFNSSKLRRYQLQRLQYYYAVVDCDSIACAAAVYDSCDGTEYESTANFFDLRYIPDGVEFGDEPRDVSFKVPSNYQPNAFITDALQHSRVRLTWDQTPTERAKVAAKAFSRKEIEDMDVRAYLASDSESENDSATAEKYRMLLGRSDEARQKVDDDVDMEITFNPALESSEAKLLVEPSETANDESLSTVDKYRLKEKERRKKRLDRYRARRSREEIESESMSNPGELDLLTMDDNESGTAASSKRLGEPDRLSRRRSKKKEMEDAEETFDTKDSRFKGLFEDPDFAIDATVSQYKKTKAMDQVMSERRKRLDRQDAIELHTSKKSKPSVDVVPETSGLVANLRRKSAKSQ